MEAYNGEKMWRWTVRISNYFHFQGRETTQGKKKTLIDSGTWKQVQKNTHLKRLSEAHSAKLQDTRLIYRKDENQNTSLYSLCETE